MKKALFCLFLLFALGSETYSQMNESPIEYRFKNGYKGFLEYAFQNFTFPDYSRYINSFGLSVVKVTITPQGAIEQILIINSIDSEVDKMLTQLLKKSSSMWQKNDTILTNQNFYFQFAFVYFNVQKIFLDKDILPTYKMFVEPVVFTASLGSNNSNKIPKDDNALTKQSTELIASGDYDKAIKPINELIKRYPYSKDLYQLRMMICKKLNDKSTIEQDLKKLNDFADGLNIDEIFNNN